MRIVLPNIVAIRQTYGDGIADQWLERVYMAIRHLAPDFVIGASADGRLMVAYEYDPEWTGLNDIAADLRSAINDPGQGNWQSFSAACSIGSASISGATAQGTSIELASELVRQADLAAELAIEHGENGFVIYTHDEDARIRRATVLDQKLRYAITHDEFTLCYQPVVDLATSETVSLEALIWWNSSSIGHCSPDEFIPAAEKSGLIMEIGTIVIEAVIQQISAWTRGGWQPPRVAINVASAQLREADFCSKLMNALAREGVAPSLIELEITERTLITASVSAQALLEEFRVSGISVALDDFGVGYSSLQYLRDLPISKLKIDRSFILGVDDNRRARALIQAIVSLGAALNMDVVAEGIETEAQAQVLRQCGCRYGQGYLYSRPTSPGLIQAVSEDLRLRARPAVPS